MTPARKELTPRQELLIAALLTEKTHVLAGAKARVSEATVKRWLRLPEFKLAWREVRRAVLETAIGRMQQLSGSAVDTLERNLTCGHPGTEVRAATALLDHCYRGVENIDLIDRVEVLEEQDVSDSPDGS
jgi:hypothetical protein